MVEIVRFFRDHKSLHCLEAFLLIAQGHDTVAAIADAMACPQSQASRMVSKLTGRGRYRQGQWLDSSIALVETRQHPHRRGRQLVLTAAGSQLLDGSMKENCTCD